MTFNFLIRDSMGWSLLFFILVVVAVCTQLAKTSIAKSVPGIVLHLIKAAPALFLAGLSWHLHEPLLLTLGLLLCGCGDILLDIPKEKASWGFEAGALAFAAALICLSIAYLGKPLAGHLLMPLSLTNLVIAVFILRWVLPKIKGSGRILEVSYFGILIISNIIASTSNVSIFLGSSLWLMSDLSIGLSSNVSDTPASSLDTLGLYDIGLYSIAIGFLNS